MLDRQGLKISPPRLIQMAVRYSNEPRDPDRFTAVNDRLYTRFASLYDAIVKVLPTWRRWLETTVPDRDMLA